MCHRFFVALAFVLGTASASLAAESQPSDLAKVIAEGMGTTADEALKDAFRNAVRQVVGAVVDADTSIQNDEVIEDKVLTYSGGFVKTYQEVAGSKKLQSGLHRVKITAQVERRSVIARLKAANVTVKQVDGASMFAEVTTQLDAEKDLVQLLGKAFEGFPQNCLTASVIGKPELVKKDATQATVRIQVQVEPDLKAYKTFADRLQPILDKVAADKGEFTATFRSVTPQFHDELQYTYFTISDHDTSWYNWMPKSFRKENDWATLALASHRTKAGDRIEYGYYLLDKSVQPVLDAISWRCGKGKLSLVDPADEIVAVDRFELSQKAYSGDFLGSLISGGQINGWSTTGMSWNMGGLGYRQHFDFAKVKMIFLVSPVFFRLEREQIPALAITRSIVLSLDELKSVHNARCEISFEQIDPDKR